MPASTDDHLTTKATTSKGGDNGRTAVRQNAQENPLLKQVTKANVTFANQDKLPKLPIPDLQSTCDKYLNALKPLQSPREHQDTVQAVHTFLEREGPELNERLKKYATGRTSYIEQFCEFRLSIAGEEI